MEIKQKLVVKELNKIRAKNPQAYELIGRYLIYLRDKGRAVSRPKADHVRGKIFELRPGYHRVLYAYRTDKHGVEFVQLLLICEKKRDELRESDIKIAQKRLARLK